MQAVQGTQQAVSRDMAAGAAFSDILARWSSQSGSSSLRGPRSGLEPSPAFAVRSLMLQPGLLLVQHSCFLACPCLAALTCAVCMHLAALLWSPEVLLRMA